MVFIAMRYFGVDANIVALSGIAIAIGTMVDLGIILSENIVKHVDEAPPGQKLITTIYNGSAEVSSAILTAVSTTIVSFIPVFTMQAAEGKLFGPLAFTKTFALVAALIVSLIILPTLAHWFFGFKIKNPRHNKWVNMLLIAVGFIGLFSNVAWAGILLILFGGIPFIKPLIRDKKLFRKPLFGKILDNIELILVVIGVVWLLAKYWLPLGAGKSVLLNFVFVALLVGFILGAFTLLQFSYRRVLLWCLNNKVKFLMIPVFLMLLGVNIWMGFSNIFGFLANGADKMGWNIRTTAVWSGLNHSFPGMGKEFMPSLGEGSFLLMPTSMPHSGVEYNRKVVGQLDMMIANIPEVELSVGKLGRVESALDPAPVSMYENVINYKSEYELNDKGHRKRFKTDGDGRFVLKNGEAYSNDELLTKNISPDELVPDDKGNYFRNWRKHIKSSDDIWKEIVAVTKTPGVTSAPKLQPIETRLVMLQTGMRAPMGIKVYGPDLQTIEEFGLKLEGILKQVPSVKAEAAFADRIVGKPYIHLNINRDEISRYGLNVEDVQQSIETAIGGMKVSSTVEGRERFPIRVRYPRELRDDPESLGKILIPTPTGAQIPLSQLVDMEYVRGAQAIKSENTFLVGYVLFDKKEGFAEVDVVNDAQEMIQQKIDAGELIVPAGINYKFSGSYENQVRAEKRLSIIVPLVFLIIFLILYFQFKSVTTSLMIFTGVAMAFSGGFIMLWLYGQGWFADFTVFGTNIRELFQMNTVNLSVAVWVGFIALFGLATDDGVLMGTYLDQSFKRNRTKTIEEIRAAIVEAGERRIRPAVMTTTTTIIALLPVLTSTGRGADIMVPMAIPAFGGMIVAAITYYIVPTLYCMREEYKLKNSKS
jgi:Cu(I)/Ag(I) efflux system membrane protein CusA/SilA